MPPARPDIRYLFVSDLHLGEENSLLSNLRRDRYAIDPLHASPVLEQWVVCLRQLLADNATPPTLVLNGDALDLAFGTISQALMSFERLLELLLPPGQALVSRILYLPGNHDHHVWEIARETQYVRTILATHRPEGLPEPQHATPLDQSATVPSFLLNQILRHVVHHDHHEHAGESLEGESLGVEVAYPNLGLAAAGGGRYLVVHHGHYVERLYHLLSDLRRWVFADREAPATVHELEAENFAWIDFVWSLLGRSGAAGTDVEAFFKMLHYPEQVEHLATSLAERVAAARNIPGVPGDWLESRVLGMLFRWLASRVSSPRQSHGADVEQAIDAGLRSYLFGPTIRQLEDELGHVPGDLAFVFGHTHKPFERLIRQRPGAHGARAAQRRAVSVVNTGGWTVDSCTPHSEKGASLLVADENLEMVALRLFDEPAPGAEVAPVRVVAVGAERPGTRALAAEVERRIRPGGRLDPAWSTLTAGIGQAIGVRRNWLERAFSGPGPRSRGSRMSKVNPDRGSG